MQLIDQSRSVEF